MNNKTDMAENSAVMTSGIIPSNGATTANGITAFNDTPADARWQDADELRWAVRHWAVRMGVQVQQVHVRPMRAKWASISPAGRITCNTELVSIPRNLGEFVIVHELVHLLAPNHGKVFKSFLCAYMPDWEDRQRCLRALEQENIRKRDS